MRGEGVCPKLLNRPVQVKYAKNRFAKHRFKALFLGLQFLPFAYGDTKFQEVQSQAMGDLEDV